MATRWTWQRSSEGNSHATILPACVALAQPGPTDLSSQHFTAENGNKIRPLFGVGNTVQARAGASSNTMKKPSKCCKVELPQWSSIPEELGNFVQPLVKQVGRNDDQRALGWQKVPTVHLKKVRQRNHFQSANLSFISKFSISYLLSSLHSILEPSGSFGAVSALTTLQLPSHPSDVLRVPLGPVPRFSVTTLHQDLLQSLVIPIRNPNNYDLHQKLHQRKQKSKESSVLSTCSRLRNGRQGLLQLPIDQGYSGGLKKKWEIPGPLFYQIVTFVTPSCRHRIPKVFARFQNAPYHRPS